MTLVGTTKPVMRRKVGSAVIVRMLLGQELMSFVGWSSEDYVNGRTEVGNGTLISLAGNAFSGFAAGPIFSAALPLLGCVAEGQEDELQGEIQEIQVCSSSSDSESD